MAGHFSTGDEERCRYYARFASHLSRTGFDVIYWLLFLLVITMLFASSWRYGRSIEAVGSAPTDCPERIHKLKRCLYACGLYAAVSAVAVVLEVFALLALQFCDGEDLMSLYWSTWTVMQAGALIAIFGVLLAVFHNMRGRKHPPWALALGTPVLVVAGLGHVVQEAMLKRVRGARSGAASRETRARTSSSSGSGSRSRSSSPRAEYDARLIGYTPEGAPIIEFDERPAQLDAGRGRVIAGGAGVVVAFHRDMATVVASRGRAGAEEKEEEGAGEDDDESNGVKTDEEGGGHGA